jgi:peptidoglycan/xylan/chitin deacetylase (PgdA/CDA1 family)
MREVVGVVAPILLEMRIPATFFLTTAFLDNRELFFKHKASILVERLSRCLKSVEWTRVQQACGMHDASYGAVRKRLLSIDYEERHLLEEIAALSGVDFAQYLRDVRPYVTTKQVDTLIEQGFSIGSHSHDHPVFSRLPLSEQLSQVIESTQFLAERFSLGYRAFAFPFNDRGVSADFFDDAARSAGVEVFFGTSSLMDDDETRCYQRTVMETVSVPAPSMLAARQLRMLLRKCARRNRVRRERCIEAFRGSVVPGSSGGQESQRRTEIA